MENLFKNKRQRALEEMVNDSVEKLALGVYKWGQTYYEVVPYSTTLKRHNWSGFVAYEFKGHTYMVREASSDVLKKYYPKVWSTMILKKAIEFNPNLVSKH